MKTIAVVDTSWGGHHETYLKLFSKTMLDLGHRVIAFCPKPIEMSKWIAVNCQDKKKQLIAVKIKTPKQSEFPIRQLRSTFNALAYWRKTTVAIHNEILKTGNVPDLVFFSYLDTYLGFLLTHYLIDRIFPYKWSGLYFQPTFLRVPPRFSSIRRGPLNPIALLKSPCCKSVAVLDEGVAEKLQTEINGKPVIIFPDATDDSSPDLTYTMVKQIQEKSHGRKIISLLGSLGKHKDLLTLLKIAQSKEGNNWFFVFAGELAEQSFLPKDLAKIKAVSKSALSNCFFHFERIPDESKFNALVNACDVLFAAYDNFRHSSGILTKVAYFKKFVIVSKGYLMEERVSKFKIGLSIPAGDVSQGIEAIQKLCNQSESNIKYLKPRFECYKSLHSIERLKTAFQSILKTIN